MDFIENKEQKLEYFIWLCKNIKKIIESGKLNERELMEFAGYLNVLSNKEMPIDERYYVSIIAEDRVFKYCDILEIPLETRKNNKVK